MTINMGFGEESVSLSLFPIELVYRCGLHETGVRRPSNENEICSGARTGI